MTGTFAWFDLRTADGGRARRFYAELLGWEIGEQGMITAGEGPFAAIADGAQHGDGRWVPYVAVEDLDEATDRATALGATVLQHRTTGPAGDFTTIADPDGAAMALWQAAA